MSAGIPDPGGVSGTFAALERTSPIVETESGVPVTTSIRIANGTQVQHKNVLELVRNNLKDFSEFGVVAFETRKLDGPGRPELYAVLNEEHATLLLTYMRNSDVVRDFKKRLVRAFHDLRQARYDELRKWAAERQPATPAIPQTYAEALRLAADEHEARELAEARVAELEPSAEAWDTLQEIGADYEVGDAAKILSRDPQINIGRNRLFEFMRDRGWIYRGRHNAWKAYQGPVDAGRLVQRPGAQYFCKKYDEYRTGDPTILVTPKGLAELRRLLGGGQLELVAAS
ncbi:phage antirepressor KilAC domain-containing protein [Mycobacterium sp. 48b]|uniref:phage antirepressor KilAC domain-containing protein n=1 Tax=Mycobacterium sp. 48b TaxID=3400426 RepID=UPI003AB02D13